MPKRLGSGESSPLRPLSPRPFILRSLNGNVGHSCSFLHPDIKIEAIS